MTYEIVKVGTYQPPGKLHEHITRVQLAGGTILSKEAVIADLRNAYGDRYVTYRGGVRANVVVRKCPFCTDRAYLTTDPDRTTANNLLKLERL